MSQALSPNGRPGGIPALPCAPELLALPAPRHLHEFLARSQHLHFGYFEAPSESLAQAQDRLILRGMRYLARGSRVVDVGCGLGGAVNLLAAHGHQVFGCDPCTRSIAYARTRATSPRAQLLACDLAQFAARARGARFDAVFLTEVLPHFPGLGAVFTQCRAVLRPGGIVVVHDVVRASDAPPGEPRFHPRGALRSAADAAGFDLLETRDVSNRVAPTLGRIARALGERRDEILAAFGPSRPEIGAEIDACQQHWRGLETRFARQELSFEASVLRCSARVGTDSVVLRAQPRPEPVAVRPPAPT